MLARVALAGSLDQVVVATTALRRDDELAAAAAAAGATVFRGSEDDVLSRYAGAGETTGAATVVRLTADCPLIDPAIIDRLVHEYMRAEGGVDIVSNNAPPYESRTYPDGMDVEVFSRAALERAQTEATAPEDREHVTRWMYLNDLRVRTVHLAEDRGAVRLTVDLPDDLARVREVADALAPADPEFSLDDILAWLDAHGREPAP
jgi:spore coat polysaccharide biosynthesis protein SpsF